MWLDRLKAMKSASGMTTKEISAESGIPEPTLEKLFAGVTKDPKLETMRKLVHVLGYTLDDLDAAAEMKKSPTPESEGLSPNRRALIEMCQDLDEETAKTVLEMLRAVKALKEST